MEARIVKAAEGEVHEPWLFKASGSQTQGRFDFMVGNVEHFSGPPLHVHSEQHDTFYILDGVLTVQAGEHIVDLEPGDFVTVPPGVPHTFDNIRQKYASVRVINVMTPGGLDELLDAAAALGDKPDAAQLAGLAEKYGAATVGPPLRTTLGLA